VQNVDTGTAEQKLRGLQEFHGGECELSRNRPCLRAQQAVPGEVHGLQHQGGLQGRLGDNVATDVVGVRAAAVVEMSGTTAEVVHKAAAGERVPVK
jgi:hypothetical protein